jgi:hypothetical protein
MRSPLLAGLCFAALTTGCAMSVPETPVYPPSPSAADPLPGASFCSRTETAARSLGSSQVAGGWVFAGLGVATTGAGAVTSLVNTGNERRIIAGTGMMLGGIALGAVAATLFMRAATSNRLAQAANMAMLDKDDHERWASCVRLKAAWTASKASPDGIAGEMAIERDAENRKLREELDELKKKYGELPPPLAPKK